MRPQPLPYELGNVHPTVVESGPDVIETGRPARESTRRWARGTGRGPLVIRRLSQVTAAIAGAAAFGSLTYEWQITRVDGRPLGIDEEGLQTLPTYLTDLEGLAAAYLVGLLLLVVSVALTLGGPRPGRPYARTAGLAIGGALLALLVAVTSLLGARTRALPPLFVGQMDLETTPIELGYGRGLWCALFAVAAASVALYLAEWRTAAADASPEAAQPPPTRLRSGDREDAVPDAPFELSVSPTRPFASQANDRHKPI